MTRNILRCLRETNQRVCIYRTTLPTLRYIVSESKPVSSSALQLTPPGGDLVYSCQQPHEFLSKTLRVCVKGHIGFTRATVLAEKATMLSQDAASELFYPMIQRVLCTSQSCFPPVLWISPRVRSEVPVIMVSFPYGILTAASHSKHKTTASLCCYRFCPRPRSVTRSHDAISLLARLHCRTSPRVRQTSSRTPRTKTPCCQAWNVSWQHQ